jgi:acetyltransferase-like isoleucine patch superfamily enzyme
MLPKLVQIFAVWQESRRRARETHRLRTQYAGTGCFVSPRAQILGWKHIRLGSNVSLADDVWLVVNDFQSSEPAIVIGDNTLIGRRNFLSAGKCIEIGSYCLTGVDCHFLGADHNMQDLKTPYLFSPVTATGQIRIGVNCWLGSRVTVLAGVEIGHGSVLGANALATKSLPAFSLSVGSPARVIKRYSFARKNWVAAADFSADEEAALPTQEAYLLDLQNSHPSPKIPKHAVCSEFGDLS